MPTSKKAAKKAARTKKATRTNRSKKETLSERRKRAVKKKPPVWLEPFVEALRQMGNVTVACRRATLAQARVYF